MSCDEQDFVSSSCLWLAVAYSTLGARARGRVGGKRVAGEVDSKEALGA